MQLIIIKIIVSVLIVLGLIFISERNSKLGGLIVGLPLGTGIMVFFYGIEQGVDFVIKAVPYGIAGMVSTIFFGMGFYIGGRLFKQYRLLNVFTSYITGLIIYLLSSLALSTININLLISMVIFFVGFLIAILFYRHVPEGQKVKVNKFSFGVLLFRILFVVAIVLTITELANIIGAKWAGIIASYPTTLSPVLIILAYSYKNEVYPVLLKHLSYSFSTIAFFYLLVLWIFPYTGVELGTLISYIICFGYLYLLSKLNFYKFIKRFTK